MGLALDLWGCPPDLWGRAAQIELLQLLVGVAKEHGLGMATYGTLMGDAMGLPHIYGSGPGSMGLTPGCMGQGGPDGAAGGADNGT